jgi:hypothetical protein
MQHSFIFESLRRHAVLVEQVRKLGYSSSVKFVREGSAETQELLMAVESLGRKKPNEMVKKITEFIGDQAQTEVTKKRNREWGDGEGGRFSVWRALLVSCSFVGRMQGLW